jgi:hypothetical protein
MEGISIWALTGLSQEQRMIIKLTETMFEGEPAESQFNIGGTSIAFTGDLVL